MTADLRRRPWPSATRVEGFSGPMPPLDAWYHKTLMQELDRALDSADTLTGLIRAAQGAFPDLALRTAEGVRGDRRFPSAVLAEPPFQFALELHPLLYEWYFTPLSASFVSELAFSGGQEWLCLGTPSVASELVSKSGRVQLIDADAGVRERFEPLRHHRGVHVMELGDATNVGPAQVTVIDPPWYLSDVLRWMTIARRFTADGGTIVLPIFPNLTRPSAWREREEIFAAAESIGQVELHQGEVKYSTPLFEQEALRAVGLDDVGDWRVSDAMVIRNVHGTPRWHVPSAVHRGDTGWQTFILGRQVIKLRTRAALGDVPTLAPIADCPNNVLTSVSERDPRRSQVGLWTSRNRVAAVGDSGKVGAWLSRMQSLGEVGDAASDDDPSHKFLVELVQS